MLVNWLKWVGVGCVCLHVGLAQAEKHALLVGVSDYAASGMKNLEGPVHDVEAMQSVLQQRWGFSPTAITALTDEMATKAGILSALAEYQGKGKPGDQLLIYLSGHGTSAKDVRLQLPLAHTTGAFVPYGTKIDLACIQRKDEHSTRCAEDALDELLIGAIDLKPQLKKLEETWQVTVVVDACFSANAARSANKEGRLIDLGIDEEFEGINIDDLEDAKYPYRNTVLLSSAGTHEIAGDISQIALESGRVTLDKKPHGTFTDALLRVLNGERDADLNRDGVVSNTELHQVLSNVMANKLYGHRPVLYPEVIDDPQRSLLGRAFLGTERQKAVPPEKSPTGSTTNYFSTINLDQWPDTQSANTLHEGLRSAHQNADITIVPDPFVRLGRRNIFALQDSAGGVIASDIYESDNDTLNSALKTVAQDALWATPLDSADFEFVADLVPSSGGSFGSTLVEGEVIDIRVNSSRAAQLLVFARINDGWLHILYPKDALDARGQKVIPANSSVLVKQGIRAKWPWGRDQLYVYAFEQWPQELESLTKGYTKMEFSGEESKQQKALLSLLNNRKYQKAGRLFDIYTVPSGR